MVKKTALEAPTAADGLNDLGRSADLTATSRPKSRTAGRRRDKSRTLSELKMSLCRLQDRGEKVTLAAVSKEAGVSSGLIHNRYPDFAEAVRALNGKSLRKQRDDKTRELSEARERIRQLNLLVATQNKQLTKLASINEMLTKELLIQKAIAEGKVTRAQFGRKTQ